MYFLSNSTFNNLKKNVDSDVIWMKSHANALFDDVKGQEIQSENV